MEELLKGYKVIELAGVLAGPSAGQFLAELGAEVIKIENPHTNGDITRQWILPGEIVRDGITAYFSTMNWGKKSLSVDLTQKEGKEIIYSLVRDADILISSYKKGDDAKLGMDEPALRKYNEKLIYAHVSGYGETNTKVAFDAVLQAESGLMSINGTQESGPLKVPVPIVDILAAHQLKEGILAAVIRRLQINEGSHVEVALMDAAIVSLSNQATGYLFTHEEPELKGSLHPTIAPYGETFKSKDNRDIILAIGANKQFAAFCQIIGIPDLAANPSFKTNVNRLQNRELLYGLLKENIRAMNAKDILQKAEEANIPVGIVQTVGEAVNHAPELTYQQAGFFGLRQNIFVKEQKQPTPPPRAGENTITLLEGLGFSKEKISDLLKRKIIS